MGRIISPASSPVKTVKNVAKRRFATVRTWADEVLIPTPRLELGRGLDQTLPDDEQTDVLGQVDGDPGDDVAFEQFYQRGATAATQHNRVHAKVAARSIIVSAGESLTL